LFLYRTYVHFSPRDTTLKFYIYIYIYIYLFIYIYIYIYIADTETECSLCWKGIEMSIFRYCYVMEIEKRKADIHRSVFYDIIYENDQQDATV
jgi:hypothetical protein